MRSNAASLTATRRGLPLPPAGQQSGDVSATFATASQERVGLPFRQPERCRGRPNKMPRPTTALRQWADHLSPSLRLAPGLLGNERHVDHDRLPPCTVVQPPLAKWQLLHTTLTRIAVERDRCLSK